MADWVAISEIVRNLGIVLGGAIGIYLGWKRVTAANRQAEAQTRQAELQRRDFVAELFNRAVSQLKDEKLEVRLGAIYTLRQICDDYPDLSRPVLELLAAYVRENAIDYGDQPPPVDIREVMSTLRGKLGGSQ
ncbi:MAG: hypothetical protein AB7S41_08085 [Parvibaculaceae bacterium]